MHMPIRRMRMIVLCGLLVPFQAGAAPRTSGRGSPALANMRALGAIPFKPVTDLATVRATDLVFTFAGGDRSGHEVAISHGSCAAPARHIGNSWAAAETHARDFTRGANDTANGILTRTTLLVRQSERTGGASTGSPADAGGKAHKRPAARPLGELSRKYEVGKGGAATISSGKGDAGGVSYGTYQMSSKVGTAQAFVNQYYPSQFKGLTPGTEPFNRKWRELAAANYAEFAARQHDFIKRTHYDKAVTRIRQRTGVDFERLPTAVQNALWSAAVQHGPTGATRIVESVIGRLGTIATSNLPALIEGMYAERGRTDPQGNLVRFKNSSKKVQEGVKKRFEQEKKDALNDLRIELQAAGSSPQP